MPLRDPARTLSSPPPLRKMNNLPGFRMRGGQISFP